MEIYYPNKKIVSPKIECIIYGLKHFDKKRCRGNGQFPSSTNCWNNCSRLMGGYKRKNLIYRGQYRYTYIYRLRYLQENYNITQSRRFHFVSARNLFRTRASTHSLDGLAKIKKRIDTLPLCSPNSRHNYSVDLLLARCIQIRVDRELYGRSCIPVFTTHYMDEIESFSLSAF